jgi:hypothetical protein
MTNYNAAAKKLQDIRKKRLEADRLLDLAEHQIMIGQIWPEAFENGQKCAAVLTASFTHPKMTLKREDGKERVFPLEVVAARGLSRRHMIFTDPNGLLSNKFIDEVQKATLGKDDSYWIDYNRAREADKLRQKALRKGYYGAPNN